MAFTKDKDKDSDKQLQQNSVEYQLFCDSHADKIQHQQQIELPYELSEQRGDGFAAKQFL